MVRGTLNLHQKQCLVKGGSNGDVNGLPIVFANNLNSIVYHV